MRRLASALFTLVLTVSFLCGCTEILPEQTIVCEELTITLPGDFVDLSDQAYAQDVEMVYGSGGIAVSVVKEPAAELAVYFPDIDAAQYAQLVIKAYDLDGEAQIIDGIPSFTYTAQADDMDITYLVGVFASDTHFWMVQVYCPAEEYGALQAQMWRYITSVTIG